VESFWSFLEGNLWKITVEDYRAALVNKFYRHCVLWYTSTNTDVLPLIREIKHAVEKMAMLDFLGAIFIGATNFINY
jgi:hypothetical protein